jgi:hypothetical protein
MMHPLILAVHLLATIAKLMRRGGVRAVVAESLMLKHQLLISSRARRRAPNLNSFDRSVLGLGSLFVPAQPLVLASRSQIRHAVLDAAGIPVEVVPADIDERSIERQAAGRGSRRGGRAVGP